jgi:hypothetical protein
LSYLAIHQHLFCVRMPYLWLHVLTIGNRSSHGRDREEDKLPAP